MRKNRFQRSRQAFAAAAVLTLVSMFLYPGGTVLESSTESYSITHNFFSDLGMTASYRAHLPMPLQHRSTRGFGCLLVRVRENLLL